MKTPYFLIDERIIERNLKVLKNVKEKAGCKILLAQKAFSCYDIYPLISKYLDGTTASGLFEAKLGASKFGGETHVFAPAFEDDDLTAITAVVQHIVFNSKAQLMKHYKKCKAAGMSIGIRINPECRTQKSDIYDPCAPLSRFGIKVEDIDGEVLKRIDGIHFHTLCEQGFAPLKKTVAEFEKKFSFVLASLGTRNQSWWMNFGGGHHITAADYDVEGLIKLIKDFKARHKCEVYLEPGEAVVLGSGTLHATVMDIVNNGRDVAVLNTSAACHNPDILETQHDYTPPVKGAVQHGCLKKTTESIKGNLYRFAGNTCLAGDIIGDYEFSKPLKVGDEIVFEDTAFYTMVKTNMFNGINLPSIYAKRLNGSTELLRQFGYDDYTARLGKKHG